MTKLPFSDKLKDRNGNTLHRGDQIRFYSSRRGTVMQAKVVSDHLLGEMMEVLVASDPFTSYVSFKQVESTTRQGAHKMPTPTAKELRKQAANLSVANWEEMDRDELVEAIEAAEANGSAPSRRATKAPAKKVAAAKKAPPTKATAKKAAAPAKKAAKTTKATKATAAKKAPRAAAEEDEEGDNPFRAGSNLHLMVEELMKGGKRSAMVRRLVRKIDLKPRVRGGRDYDPEAEIDYRLVRTCQILTNDHGFVIEKEGRGTDQIVKAVPPSQQ